MCEVKPFQYDPPRVKDHILTTNKGRSYGRTSNNQISPDVTGLAFHILPTPSASSGRRSRGFQPSEVDKPKQDAKQDLGPAAKVPSTEAPTHAEESTNLQTTKITESLETPTATKAPTPPEDPISHPEVQLHDDESINHTSQTPAQTATMHASHLEFDAVDAGTVSKSNVSEGSSVQIITQERQPSCWSKVAPTPATTPGWDNGTTDLNTPAWMLRDAQLSELPNAPKRANMANLPEYKFPGSGRKKQDTPSRSFDRQDASRGRSGVPPVLPQVTNSLPEWGSTQMQNFPPLQNKPQAQDSLKAETTEAKNNKALEQALVEPAMQAKQESTNIPPHLKALHDPLKIIAKAEAKLVEAGEKIPPHLRKTVIPSISAAQNETVVEDRTGKQTITAMQNYYVPPHQRHITGKSNTITMPSSRQGGSGDQPAMNVAKEVIAVLPVPDREEKVALAVQAKPSDDKEIVRPTQSDSYEVTNNSTDQETAVPPHLRATKTTSIPPAKVKMPTTEVKPEIDHSWGPKLITTNGLHNNALKDVTQSRQNGKTGLYSNGGAFARGSESAVRAGKKPATNGHFVNHDSGLVGWDGKMVAPPIGDDWDYRQRYDPSGRERFSVIEAWREEQATDPGAKALRLDTDSPDFQTGSGLAGGMQSFMSPIDEAHHEAIPNDDDFTQARREQNAAAAIEAMKAKSSANSTSPKSEKDKVRTRKEQMSFLKEQNNNRVILPSQYAPKANIYLRPAEHKDMRQCADIYNYYVQETDSAPEFKPVDELHWRDRLQEAQDEGNPFIVAIHMGQKRENNVQNIRRKKQETVVGFAAATDFGLQRTCYRFTKEMDLWVHKDHLRQGIGRTMLDRMLSAMDPGYNILECAPLLGDYQLDHWVGGGHCITKVILINILHSDGETADVEWKKKWLSSDRNNFQYAGSLTKIGRNKNKEP